jgi:hypothetical protein
MPTKETSAKTTLVTVAESIGSALGAVAATADKAKGAIIARKFTPRYTKRKVKQSLRRASAKVVRAARVARKSGPRRRSSPGRVVRKSSPERS